MKRVLFAAVLGGLTLASCSSNDDTIIENEKIIDVPANYTFERDGNSSVHFDGQTTRLEMTSVLASSFKDFNNATEESLSNMFSNTNNPFSSEDLNTSDKSIKSKVAASDLYFSTNTVESVASKNDFEGYITAQINEVFPNENEVAARGVAGQIADGSSVRYVNPQGLEWDQAFAKGLIGALVADQVLNHYLASSVLDAGDNVQKNNDGLTEDGKSYTTMEHKWDEAYGYVYGHPSVPSTNPNSALTSNSDPLLFKYLGRVNSDPDFAGIAEETFDAFKLGRAAIVAGEYDVRDEQIDIIRENISKVIGIRAVYYLQAGKRALEEGKMGTAFHDLSEGYGFIYSLRFTHNPDTNSPYLSKSEVDDILETLMAGDGFWDVTPLTLDALSEAIAAPFNFTVAEAAE
ncbi:DUF4856 domain-containing protein [Antarcticibacterium flavum]|uniref:DUF4856 domain-containing protein n=1 Tax=Antarcticibacterium flavum TaxID=2058175 RepID=A0A5B7X4X5_9FLAO|nr:MULTISPECIES: DUF4856 domain-containing protein [Antarcticibacterium]MCM4159970.1 DUF4856 domain-containing protein [Antarcticibacterium sp. W02-3]QCY70437.1 DUF4856 domain-containing protein [Antarcticibacterium flavum]